MREAMAGLREQLRYEPVIQRIRVLLGDQLVAETSGAALVWEPRCIVPAYAVPASDIAVPATFTPYDVPDPAVWPPLITPEHRGVLHLAEGSTVTLTVGDRELAHIGFRFDDPDLAGLILLRWDPFTWQEENATMTGHAQDVFARIRTLPSDRRVRVSYRGTLLAESTRPVLLLETGLPPRWYLPREDLTPGLFTESDHHTVCAYKGLASYLSLRRSPGDDPRGRDLGWYYPDPRHDAEPVRDMVCFWNERTDLEIDGVLVPRPRQSPFAREEP